MITPISKTKLYEEISNQITDMIQNDQWKPGEKIPTETTLSQSFSVSRSTVREAIKSLQISKILVSKTGMGTFVSENAKEIIASRELLDLMNDEDYIKELVEVRFIIEPHAAYLAAQKKDDAGLKRLYDTIPVMKGSTTKEEMLSSGFLFHNIIAELSGNRILQELYRSMSARLFKMRSLDFLTKEVYDLDVSEHTMIADAIKDGRAKDAYKLMEKHLKDDYKGYIK